MNKDQEADPKKRGVERHGQRSRSWSCNLYTEEWKDMNRDQEAGHVICIQRSRRT